MKKFALGLMLAGSLFAHNSQASSTVFNGTVVTPDEKIAKSTVNLLMLGDKTVGSCTGTLISKKLILTAAHCFGEDTKYAIAIFGNIENMETLTLQGLDQKGIAWISASEVAAHADFARSGGKSGDVALLKLKSPAPQGYNPVPMVSSQPAVGTHMILAGFGNAFDPFSEGESDDRTLRKIGKTLRAVYQKSLVFENKVSGVSHGDSGGPAYIQDAQGNLTVAGITNAGLEAGIVFFASVYDYLGWIKSQPISQGEL